MKASTIKKFLESPLGEALASDFAIMGGLEALKAAFRANRRTASSPGQQTGTTDPLALPAPPKDLHKALLKLKAGEEEGHITEVTEWMKSLHHAHKLALSKWELDDLNTLFALPPKERTQLISAVTGPTPIDEWEKFKRWVGDHHLKLDDESKAIIKEWEDWADDILKQR